MIYDRAPGLEGSWREAVAMPFIKAMVRYDRAADYVGDWVTCANGAEVVEVMHETLRPNVRTVNGHNVPRAGEGCLLIGNHPTGLPDGLAFYDYLRGFRRDVAIIVFHDLLSINPRATDCLIPHDWRPAHRTMAKARETMRLTKQALDANRLVAIFPSGDIAYWNGRQLRDYPWQKAFITFARKFNRPIIPAHIRARNSVPYYFLRLVSTTLRDLFVIREIQNKIGSRFDVTYGPRVEPEQLVGDADELTVRFQRYVEDVLPNNADAHFLDS